jgi:hypothetical protein
MLAAQFADFMILVLIAAAVIDGALGEPEDRRRNHRRPHRGRTA